MGFAHLLKTEAALATFRAKFDNPLDVDIKLYPKGNMENVRRPRVVFISFIGYFRKRGEGGGGVSFPVDPLLLRTLSFHGLWPDQLPSNFYRVVSCVSRLNNLYGLRLNHRDINFMYIIYGGSRMSYYLKF